MPTIKTFKRMVARLKEENKRMQMTIAFYTQRITINNDFIKNMQEANKNGNN